MPLAAMAAGIEGFGTRAGTSDSQAGWFRDQAALRTNVVSNRRSGEAKSAETRAAKTAIIAAIA